MNTPKMNVLVIGGGATGSYLAGRLLEKGAKVDVVTGVARQQQLALRDLNIVSPFGRCRRPVRAIRPAEIEKP
ncbi:MAG: ketopantoate reductase family protein [Hyphomicrobiaceae bacterium]